MGKRVRQHGTHSAYSAGCRCDPCRVAHREYERNRARHRRRVSYGFELKDDKFVDASEAREHLLFLETKKIGLRSISESSGVATSWLLLIKQGKKKQIGLAVHNKIIAVPAKPISSGQFISAEPSKKLVAELIDLGYTRGHLGYLLGDKHRHLILRTWIRVERAERIKKLHERLTYEARLKKAAAKR